VITRSRRRADILRNTMLLLVLPFGMMTVAYALFSQNLSLSGTTSTVAYVSNQSMMMTYTKTQSVSSPYAYSIAMSVKNGSATRTTVWQVNVDVPSDVAGISCPTTVFCTLQGTRLTILSNTNGAINAGGSTAVTFSFTSSINAYTLQNIAVYANSATSSYATINGLSVNTSVGTRSSSSPYTRPLTVTVTNISGKPILQTRVTISPFSNKYSVTGLPAGVTKSGTSTLILTNVNEIATGNSQQYSLTRITGLCSPTF
jgi:hypothetical protein